MASQERIKLIQAEVKATERLKKLQSELSDAQKAGNTALENQLKNNIQKIENFIDKTSGIKDGVDEFKNLSDNISLSSKSTAELSKSLSLASKNLQAISSVSVGINFDTMDTSIAESTAGFVSEFQVGASLLAEAQSNLQNADPTDTEGIKRYKEELSIATSLLDDSVSTNQTLLAQNKSLGRAVLDFVKAERNVNKEIMATVGLTEDEVDQYRQLTSEADRMSTRMKAFADQITTYLKKPRVLIGAMIIGFGSVINKIGEVNSELGTTLFQTDGVGRSAGVLSIFFKDAASTAKQLSNELGSTARATFELQTNIGLMSTTMGVSAGEATSLIGSFTRLNGNSTDIAQDMMATTREFAQQNNIIPGALMADLANSTEEFALFGNKGGENILRAAGYAQRLGVNMGTLSKISEGLLDFESSITNELELGVMLGKNINLNKARELAFNNDIEGAARETLKQVGGVAAFERMTYYQRQQTAKTLGITVGELQKMVTNEKEAGQLGRVIKKEFSQVNELINGGLNKYLGTSVQALGGILMTGTQFGSQLAMMGVPMKGLISGFGNVLSKTALVGKNIGKWALGPVLKMTKGIGGAIANTELGKAVGKGVQSVRAKLLDGASSKVDFSKTADRAQTASKIDSKTPKGKSGLSSLARGLKSMGDPKVLFGAFNLIPTALGFVAILPGIPGMIAVSLLGGPAGVGLRLLGNGLKSFGNAVSKALPQIGLGLLVLAGFGAALIPLAYALSVASPAITAFGDVIKGAFEGIASIITATSEGLVSMLGVITLEKAGAMIALGAAFPLLAVGIGSLAIAATLGGGKVTSFIQGIAESASLLGGGAAQGLQTTAQALMSMGSGLSVINEQLDRLNPEKLDALSNFSMSLSIGGAVTAIGDAVGGLVDSVSAVIGGGNDEEGSLSQYETDALRYLERIAVASEKGATIKGRDRSAFNPIGISNN